MIRHQTIERVANAVLREHLLIRGRAIRLRAVLDHTRLEHFAEPRTCVLQHLHHIEFDEIRQLTGHRRVHRHMADERQRVVDLPQILGRVAGRVGLSQKPDCLGHIGDVLAVLEERTYGHGGNGNLRRELPN